MPDLKEKIIEKASFADYKRFYSQYFDNIGKANPSGNVSVVCPFHDDTDPSLSINLFNGLYKCFGCDASGDAFEFYQKKEGGDFKKALNYFADFLNIDRSGNGAGGPVKAKTKKGKKLGEVDVIYDYVDADGKLIHQTIRYKNPKDFRQRRPDPDKPGKFIWSIKGVEVVPYNLVDVLKSNLIYIVEGEKDVETLKAIGLVASCGPMGAGKWPDSLSQYFQGKEIIILPDNDKPGRDHAILVASKLNNIAASIKIVNLPDLPDGGDITDWIEYGKTQEDLLTFIDSQGDDPEYESHIDYLNRLHAAIMIGGKFLIMNHDYDPIFNRPDISFSSAQDFMLRYKNRKIPNPLAGIKGQPKEISIAKDWLESPERKQYTRMVFAPNNNVPSECYNLWRGMACEPKKGEWNLFYDHIYKVIANGDSYIRDWILTWMARLVQDPGGKRPGTAIVLRGEQGVGKGCFLTGFGKLFGNHYLSINNQKQLISRFNNQLKDVIFLFVDEGFWAGDKGGEGVLKGLITEDTMTLESKGKDIIVIKNHINLAMASNNDWVVPTGFGERRFFVLDVSTKKKQNIPYFRAILKQMNNGGREAMLYDLLEYDRTKIDIRQFPQTSAGIDQLTASIPPVQQFWFDRLKDGNVLNSTLGWGEPVLSNKLYNEYINFCNDIGIRYRATNAQFGKQLRYVCPGVNKVRRVSYQSSVSGVDRAWFYQFPELEICRQDFIKKIGQVEFDWENDEIIKI